MLVEVGGDLGEQLLIRDELVECERAVWRVRSRHDMHADRVPVGGRHADDTRHPRGGLSAEVFEVLGGDGAMARADLQGRAVACAVERLGVHAAARGLLGW